MRDYIEMTWDELDAFDREKTCFFQVVAPVEEHSRHLPLGTDLYLGEAWTRQAAISIEERYSDVSCVIMPPLPIAAGSMPGFPGCLYQKPKELRRTVYRQLEPLAKDGWKAYEHHALWKVPVLRMLA